MTSHTASLKTKNGKTVYPSTESALYFVEDVMDRAMIPFVLLGDVARAVVDHLDVEVTQPIEIGVRKQHLTEYAMDTLPMFLPPDTVYGDKKISFEWQGTPVTIKIIYRNFKVMEKPDTVFYKITNFNIPNPFETYWKQRSFVQ